MPFDPSKYGTAVAAPTANSAPPTATPDSQAGSDPTAFDPSKYGTPVTAGDSTPQATPETIQQYAKDPSFFPDQYVASKPGDQDALTLAANVQKYREDNNIGTLGADLSEGGQHPFSSAYGVAKGYVEGIPGFVKSAANAGALTGNLLDRGILYGGQKLIGDNSDANQNAAQMAADSQAIKGAWYAGLNRAAILGNQVHQGRMDQIAGQTPDIPTYEGRILKQVGLDNQQQKNLSGAPIGPLSLQSGGESAQQIASENPGVVAPSPKSISDLSNLIDPKNLALMAAGGMVGPALGSLSSLAPESISAAVSPSGFVGGTLQNIGRVAQGARAVAANPTAQGIVRGAGIAKALYTGEYGPLIEEEGLVRGMKAFGKSQFPDSMRAAGENISQNGFGDNVNPIITLSGKLLPPIAGGAAAGLAFSLPFLAQNNQPIDPENMGEQIGQNMAAGSIGALGANLFSSAYLPAAIADTYHQAANNESLKGTLSSDYQPYQKTPSQVNLNQVHEDSIEPLTPQQQQNFNRARDLVGNNSQIYSIPPATASDFYTQLTGDTENAPAQGANGVVIPSHMIPGWDGPPITLIGSDQIALGHEVGHVFEPLVDPTELQNFYNWAIDNKAEDLQNLMKFYNGRMNGTQGWQPITDIADPRLLSEYFAEQTQNTLNGKSFAQLGSKDPLSIQMMGLVGQGMEKIMGGSAATTQSALGVKPSFASDAFMRKWLDQLAQNRPNQGASDNDAGTPSSGAAPDNNPTPPPDQVIQGIKNKIFQNDQEGRAITPKRGQPQSSLVGDDLRFRMATQDAANAMQSGQLQNPFAVEQYLHAALSDSPTWNSLSGEERSAVANLVIDSPQTAVHYFDEGAQEHAKTVQQLNSEQADLLNQLGAKPKGNSPMPVGGGSETGMAANEGPLANIPAPSPNIRVGEAPKAPIKPFQQPQGTSFTREPAPLGLKPATRRSKPNPVTGEVKTVQLKSVKGPGFGPSPQDQALKQTVLQNTQNPAEALRNQDAFELARQNGQNISFTYHSAEHEGDQAPTAAERREAQKAANEGRAPRNLVQKNGAPMSVEVSTDETGRPQGYWNLYSQDKAITNAHNLAKALSNLKGDPQLEKVSKYLSSPEFPQDMQDRAQNMNNGYRGDGKIFKGPKGEDVNAAWRNPDYKPIPIPDEKIQILNTVDGGPSQAYWKEQQANASDTSRKPPSNPIKESSNPLWNKLKDIGSKLQVGESKGIQNIVSGATEKVRLDRVGKVNGTSDVTLPQSDYGQRSAAFMPTLENAQVAIHKAFGMGLRKLGPLAAQYRPEVDVSPVYKDDINKAGFNAEIRFGNTPFYTQLRGIPTQEGWKVEIGDSALPPELRNRGYMTEVIKSIKNSVETEDLANKNLNVINPLNKDKWRNLIRKGGMPPAFSPKGTPEKNKPSAVKMLPLLNLQPPNEKQT